MIRSLIVLPALILAPFATAPWAAHDRTPLEAARTAPADGEVDSLLTARVTKLADRYVAALLEFFPEQGEFAGLSAGPHDRLTDNSLVAVRRWQQLEDSVAAALAPIQAAALAGTPAWITYGYLRAAVDAGRATRVCRSELWSVNNLWGWQTSMPQLAALQPVGTPEARTAALARWQGLPRYVRTEIVNLREGIRRGYTAPIAVVRAVTGQLNGLLSTPPESLPFMDPARRDSTPGFQAAWRVIVTDSVRVAAETYRRFLQREYAPVARPATAVTANPDGRACYRALLQQATSVDHDPAALWRAVSVQVTRDSGALMRVATEVYRRPSAGSADIGWLRRELEADSANRLPSPDSIRAFTTAAMARVRAVLPRWFARVPTGDVVLVPFPEYQQPTAPAGQYIPGAEDGSRPATYLYRTHQPVHRVALEATVFHETWPGHHLQSALIGQQRGRHPITRLILVSGFAEGWATYAESLAEEMGVYGSKRDRLGAYLSLAPLMAADLGLQTRGWSPAEARRYIELHAPNLPVSRIPSLVDLIAGAPGFLASYTVGAIEFRRLRREAEQALGSRFDVREFHQVLLEDGAIPLPLLAEKVELWIATKGGESPPAGAVKGTSR